VTVISGVVIPHLLAQFFHSFLRRRRA